MSTAYVFTVHQYIEKNKKKTCFHVPTSPPDCSPQLKHYPTFRCFHFWHSSKTKKKTHAPPGFHPGNPCENLDPNAKPPRPQPTGKTTQPDGFTAQATYAAGSHRRRNCPRPAGEVTFCGKKHLKKTTCIFENTPCSIFQKKT